jgi:hypothetical protein
MNVTIKTFLDILKAALTGEKPVFDREIPPEEWEVLFQMARIHNVLPLMFEAVYASPSAQAAQPLLASVKRPVMRQVVMQTMQTTEFLALNKLLQSAGIRPLVVKGMICRNLYPQPDHRPSGDEDVLIPPERYEECHRLLTEFGMQTTVLPEEAGDAYEVPYTKAGSPLYIELHKHLFPPQSDAYGDMNRFFEDIQDRAVAEEIQGHTIYTLAPTDHLFYLICHAFKHFLHSGFGIRQVCDIVLYANRYGGQLDWIQILENCKAIHAEKFAAALFQIGGNYLVFDPGRAMYPEAWQQIQVDEMPMLEDLLCGGLYGDSSMSRKHSSTITLDAVAAQKQGRKAKNSVIASVFPSAASLENRYPYLKKHPYLLPAAWCSRLVHYARESSQSEDNNASEALRIGSERVELMKTYGILK